MKHVLILCTGNSCRSIIAEALLNHYLGDCLQAYSSGVAASGRVHPDAKKVLQAHHIWQDSYYSKALDTVLDGTYDLVVTVCDNAQVSCPTFPNKAEVIHVGFVDPDGKNYAAFEQTYQDIKKTLLPLVQQKLCVADG